MSNDHQPTVPFESLQTDAARVTRLASRPGGVRVLDDQGREAFRLEIPSKPLTDLEGQAGDESLPVRPMSQEELAGLADRELLELPADALVKMRALVDDPPAPSQRLRAAMKRAHATNHQPIEETE